MQMDSVVEEVFDSEVRTFVELGEGSFEHVPVAERLGEVLLFI